MNCVHLALFVLELVLLNYVQSKKLCDYADTQCTTLGAQNVYKSVMPGIEGVMEPSDPLYMMEITGELPSFEYQLSNVTLSGMSNCQVTLLMLKDEESTYQFDIICPQLVLNYHYICKGLLGPVEIDGKGVTTVIFNDYMIEMKGKYGYYFSHMDQELHFYLRSVYSEFNPQGEVVIDVQGPLNSNEAKSELARAYIYEHTGYMEQILRSPTMKSFMAVLMERIDTYLRTFPADQVIPVY